MQNHRCASCGKIFDLEKDCLCPRCGAAIPPSLLTRLERKETARRLRSEGKMYPDPDCHEDDSWKDSYGAHTHREAVRKHEQELRETYRRADPEAGRSPAARSRKRKKKLRDRIQERPALLLLFFLLPFVVFLILGFLSTLFAWVREFSTSYSITFP